MLKLSNDVLLSELKKVMEYKYKVKVEETSIPDSNDIGWTIQQESDHMEAAYHVCNMNQMCAMYMKDPIPLSTLARLVYMTIKMKDIPAEELNAAGYANWDTVKNKLFLSPCKINGNERGLKEQVFCMADDLALTVRILLNPSGTFTSSAPLTKDMLEKKYHISPREAIKSAKTSFANMCEVKFSVLDALPNITCVRCTLEENGRNLDGAAGIFMDGIMDKIKNIYEEDFYILPISIGYSLCIPLSIADTDDKMSHFKNKIQEFYEEEAIDDVHRLSKALYKYQNGKFIKVEEDFISV